LPDARELIRKNPLYKFKEEEKEAILYCRDYISTIPSALEVFLRCIDWLNPLQVNIAKIYLKKWARIAPEDAVCLLDARYPDTSVREYAVSILRDLTDDLMSLYMLQMCQSLMYEPHLVSPLSEFLIEKSIKNPHLIGSKFYWNAKVSMNNRLFKERLSVFVTQILMLTGPSFLECVEKSAHVNASLKNISLCAKETYRKLSGKEQKPVTKKQVKDALEKLEMNNFSLPIHPSYFVRKFALDNCMIFGSKMVPIVVGGQSTDNSVFRCMFKNGDDLRQDVLTLQILKIMDKIWLENDLDLKLVTYKVLPTGLKNGFIEFVEADVIDELQQRQGVGGALDKELLIKHLRNVGQPANQPAKYDPNKQYDNFVKSLAGFCVATCVLGIGDRHPGNVMIKNNGIFFHIDYGHFLGNFKYKFGIKRERAPFLLTPDMAHVYTKTGREELFKRNCIQAYNILRKNASRLMNLFIIMSSAGI
jgi:phosphatidylinositol-4,5-bisphosphate 3-kinase